MKRLIVTGANGSGKSHLAARLSVLRPEVPVVSFDAIKLARDWKQRPRPEVEADLARVVAGEAWILEGGPSLLSHAVERAQGLIWLDPPDLVRAWRLTLRPWRNLGRTRPELPPGNADRLFEQYGFAIRSLRAGPRFRSAISACLTETDGPTVWHCRSRRQIDEAVAVWRAAP